MKKSFFTSLGCTLMFTFNIQAGDPALSKGVDLFEAGMYSVAQRFFKAQPPSGESYYYLGEIAYIEEKLDSASYYYDLGLTSDPPFMLGYVGKGKLMLKVNIKEAEATMQKAFTDKASKKDPAIYTAIGSAYAANKMIDKAKDYFKQARSIDKNYAGSYIAEGNMLMADEKVSDASNKYDMAAFQDKKNKPSRLKLAEIYFHVNRDQAQSTINEILAIDKDYAPAYRLLGELYYEKSKTEKGQLEKASEAYARYLSFGYGNAADYARYATILFFNKDYSGSLAEVEKALAKNPDNLVMKRLLGYNLFEIERHEDALAAMISFIEDPRSNHIGNDYMYYARILRKNQQDSLSIHYFTKALELDQTNKSEILKEIAQIYDSMKDFAMAGHYYEQYIEHTNDAGSLDYFYCGRNFYNAAGLIKNLEILTDVDSLEMIRLFKKADQHFESLAERHTSYLGNFWRARVHFNLDPESTQGLAKPYFEQAMMKLEEDPSKRPLDLLECYKYFGYYYYLQEDKETSISYLTKALAIAPNDPQVNELYKFLTAKPK